MPPGRVGCCCEPRISTETRHPRHRGCEERHPAALSSSGWFAGGDRFGHRSGHGCAGLWSAHSGGGWPPVSDGWVVKANPRWPIARRLGHMLQGLEEVYALTRPSFVAVETAFTHRNPKTAIRLGEARGVAIASAYQFGAEVHEVSPSEAKNASRETDSLRRNRSQQSCRSYCDWPNWTCQSMQPMRWLWRSRSSVGASWRA